MCHTGYGTRPLATDHQGHDHGDRSLFLLQEPLWGFSICDASKKYDIADLSEPAARALMRDVYRSKDEGKRADEAVPGTRLPESAMANGDGERALCMCYHPITDPPHSGASFWRLVDPIEDLVRFHELHSGISGRTERIAT